MSRSGKNRSNQATTVGTSPVAQRCVVGLVLSILALPITTGCTDEGLPILGPLPFNFHVLENGRAYRSSQPTGDQLAWLVDQYGIKTVVNLRGPNDGKSWYDTERAVCDAMGIVLADHRMSSQELPQPDVLAAAINTFETAEYPLLIHCQSGSDRTGMMSGVYRVAIMGHSNMDAMQELAPAFFHFRSNKPCMDVLVEIFEPTDEWLQSYAETFDQLVCIP